MFLGILIAGYVWVWKKGALEWVWKVTAGGKASIPSMSRAADGQKVWVAATAQVVRTHSSRAGARRNVIVSPQFVSAWHSLP